MKNLCTSAFLLFSLSAYAGPRVVGGGNETGLEFEERALTAMKIVSQKPDLFLGIDSTQLSKLFDGIVILVTNQDISSIRNGVNQPATAINFRNPDPTVEVNEQRWSKIKDPRVQEALALHELLSLLGLESTGDYKYSQAYLNHFGLQCRDELCGQSVHSQVNGDPAESVKNTITLNQRADGSSDVICNREGLFFVENKTAKEIERKTACTSAEQSNYSWPNQRLLRGIKTIEKDHYNRIRVECSDGSLVSAPSTTDLMTEKICMPKKIKTYQIVAGDAHLCALTEYGVTCWGDDSKGQTDVPIDLRSPKQLAAYGNTTCAIVNGGVRCWGEERSFLGNMPQFTMTPDQISISVYQACAIANGKVICWDGRETYNYPVRNAKAVVAGGPNVSYSPTQNFLCAIGDDGLQCFNRQESIYENSSKVEQMRGVTQISLSSASGCAITSKGVECFTYNNSWIRDFPGLQPKGLAVGGWAWAITEDGLVGWGSEIAGPPEYIFQGFPSISQVALGGRQKCILYAGGVSCEGINDHRQLEIPDEL